MCPIAKQLLAEKLIDDFYEAYARGGQQKSRPQEDLVEQLKARLPTDQHAWLYRWEAECVETCTHELQQFANFIADLLMATPVHASDARRHE
ncbi:hypothetical protein [Ferroacidibacillus organovorans]|uniref:Uncharacterized protein n=1 Tax=Ferroacidibacillus organovorans TaxID=1765683 RepID=A0A853K730_9BACL|nr:hypothetical protein [Ferroacidibacillus organovorans]KYP79538.1 hypothetical protein AYJ22_14395 [Ferroacidibacillus organovorans]OAG91129.1 hypothetical protein AYW79_13860 [Ferroacidibacillus organovorans]